MCIFSPDMPMAPPPAPDTAAAEAAAARERQRAINAKGRASTILTSGEGVKRKRRRTSRRSRRCWDEDGRRHRVDRPVVDRRRARERRDALAGDRQPHASWPRRFRRQADPGARRTDQLFDSTALTALDNLAGGLWGTITNSANKWFEIRCADESAMRRQDVKLWCAATTDEMLKALAANGQRFYAQAIASYRDICAFGSLSFHCQHPDPSKKLLHFESKPLARSYVAENAARKVDLMFEKFEYSARQAVGQWKDRTRRSARRTKRRPTEKLNFISTSRPRRRVGTQACRGAT